MRNALMLAATFSVLAAMPAHAQVVEDRPIVVTGKKGTPRQQALRQLRQIVSTVDGQLARFAEPVCPMVIGLSLESNATVAGRIRDIASEAGAKVAPERCNPNIVIIVAADADVFTKALRKRFPKMFAYLRPGELRRAKREGPVHAWNTVEVRNDVGESLMQGEGDDPPTLEIHTASRIILPTQQVTLSSIVVIDDEAAVGKSLVQIADYAAMRTLAGARPPREPGMADTILSLFDRDGGTPPPSLTRLDSSFIKELYAGEGTATASQKKNAISRRAAAEQ